MVETETETQTPRGKRWSKGAAVQCNLKPGPLRAISLAVATGLGTGYAPFASGTVGSLVGVVLFWFMTGPYAFLGWFGYAVATAILIVLAVQVSTVAEGVFGRKDDGRVAIDEIVGYLVTMFLAPHTAFAAAAGFVLFRFFDVLKPWPSNNLQALKGGLGIVIDDLVAGVYALVSLQVLLQIVN
ncbi:phosphatidylglycerophosphatase A [Candidatus Sumerlaeota bacterium]|nr:phosphatidylglycerophosphatase A [Candidatus Sumerlaeota bacterium]